MSYFVIFIQRSLSLGPQVIYPIYLTADLLDRFEVQQSPEQFTPHFVNLTAYWAIYAAWCILERIFPLSFIAASLPLYEFLKTLVCLWLVHPQTGGAASFWLQTVKPNLKDKIAFAKRIISKAFPSSRRPAI